MDLQLLTNAQRRRITCIGESYQRLTGRALVSAEGDPVEALWSSPVAVVAHGTEPDPIFFFGNRTALALFEMDFGTFTRLPSRLSAEPMLRDERARLLERVTRDGLIEDYAGVRISATGKRFRISNASVWNLAHATGEAAGQAAAFAEWTTVASSG
ncbi:MEKHLA domain-containing protein [Hyphomicrobium sp.]|uniref:MEKHLA domain-containing protein n=1 Tax=Hyphomicrobium sp. TaxID=82 RepID=UPI0025B7BCFC|nr:MEKHLA domain-containing protein [Hyphomicrobium sp.]MCC7250314.1 MEKHLA domain-containing protein [Hyphomicrobium sp.]